MPNLSVVTSLPKVNCKNLRYCHFIRIVLIIQVQNQERSMRLNKQYALLIQLRLLTRVYSIGVGKLREGVCGCEWVCMWV